MVPRNNQWKISKLPLDPEPPTARFFSSTDNGQDLILRINTFFCWQGVCKFCWGRMSCVLLDSWALPKISQGSQVNSGYNSCLSLHDSIFPALQWASSKICFSCNCVFISDLISELQFLVRHSLSHSKKFFKSKALGAFPCRPPVAEGGIVLAQCHPITATSSHPLKILGAD